MWVYTRVDLLVEQSWDDVYSGYLLELDGFTPGTSNKIKITNGPDLTPDFVSLGVQA